MQKEDFEGTLWRKGEKLVIAVNTDHTFVTFPGLELGAAPYIIKERGRFLLLRYPGHKTWAGRGDCQYVPSRYLLLEKTLQMPEYSESRKGYSAVLRHEEPYTRALSGRAKRVMFMVFDELAGPEPAESEKEETTNG